MYIYIYVYIYIYINIYVVVHEKFGFAFKHFGFALKIMFNFPFFLRGSIKRMDREFKSHWKFISFLKIYASFLFSFFFGTKLFPNPVKRKKTYIIFGRFIFEMFSQLSPKYSNSSWLSESNSHCSKEMTVSINELKPATIHIIHIC